LWSVAPMVDVSPSLWSAAPLMDVSPSLWSVAVPFWNVSCGVSVYCSCAARSLKRLSHWYRRVRLGRPERVSSSFWTRSSLWTPFPAGFGASVSTTVVSCCAIPPPHPLVYLSAPRRPPDLVSPAPSPSPPLLPGKRRARSSSLCRATRSLASAGVPFPVRLRVSKRGMANQGQVANWRRRRRRRRRRPCLPSFVAAARVRSCGRTRPDALPRGETGRLSSSRTPAAPRTT